MSPLVKLAISSIFLLLQSQASHGYGSSGGSSGSCTAPIFYDESPPRNSAVPAFRDFAITASDNTDLSTLTMEINGAPVSPVTEALRSGESRLTITLPAAIGTAGKVRITIAAKSKENCPAFQPIYLEVKP